MWKSILKKNRHDFLLNGLRSIYELQKIIFSIYLARDYNIKHFFYEKKLQEKNRIILDAFHQLREQHPLEKTDHYFMLEHCYNVLIEMSTLRYRLKDPVIFEICHQELLSISTEISHIFDHLLKKNVPQMAYNPQLLQENIFSLESIYQNVLQATLAEPIIFLIFIENLIALEKTLTQLSKRCYEKYI